MKSITQQMRERKREREILVQEHNRELHIVTYHTRRLSRLCRPSKLIPKPLVPELSVWGFMATVDDNAMTGEINRHRRLC